MHNTQCKFDVNHVKFCAVELSRLLESNRKKYGSTKILQRICFVFFWFYCQNIRRMEGIFYSISDSSRRRGTLSALKATEQLHLLNLQISQVFLQFNHLHWYEILVVKFCLNTYTLTCRYYCIICEIVLQDIANNKVP